MVLNPNSGKLEVFLTEKKRSWQNGSMPGSDQSLWDALRLGDKKALDYIFENYISVLQWYGGKVTKNQAIVEDSIQELFIELWNKQALLSSTTSIKFYLFKSLRRRVIKKLKSENWHKGFLSLGNISDLAFDFSRESAIIDEEIDDEKKKYVRSLMGNLSKRQQEIIYLKFYEDLPATQIAEIMGLTIPSVYSLIGKAFAALRKAKKHL